MSHQIIRLGVNIDHVATLRQARGTNYPDPVQAALLAVHAGADGITVHLREDRRHIQERDVLVLMEVLQVPLNLEMATTAEMVAFACRIKPAHCCLVPEKRQELTTEGGLDVVADQQHIAQACQQLKAAGIEVSLFIDPEIQQIDAAIQCGAPVIELHTGTYAEAVSSHAQVQELARIRVATEYAVQRGLVVNAGHGLHYENTQAIAAIPNINELNIGHSIVTEALFVGMAVAVNRMKALMVQSQADALQSR